MTDNRPHRSKPASPLFWILCTITAIMLIIGLPGIGLVIVGIAAWRMNAGFNETKREEESNPSAYFGGPLPTAL